MLFIPSTIIRRPYTMITRIKDALLYNFYIQTNSYLTFKKVVRFRRTLSVHQHIYISITLFAKMRNLCNLVFNLFAHIEIAQLFFYCKKIPCIMYQIVSKVWTFILSSTVPKSNKVVVIDYLCKITAIRLRQMTYMT